MRPMRTEKVEIKQGRSVMEMRVKIELDVPEWQIGQQVEVFFPDTMMKKGVCELLKEQEAMKPLIMQDPEGIWFTCQRCGHKIRAFMAMKMDLSLPNFCSECGQAVKWK